MNIIKEISEKDFGRTERSADWPEYDTRLAARAILLDQYSRVALMYVASDNYYKLPGGGIDNGEDMYDTLKRELAEEVGTISIKVTGEVGLINEYRDKWRLKSEHYCFTATVIGPLSNPARTQEEIDEGYETIWTDTIDNAIQLVESGKPIQYGHDFERLRELYFLKEARMNSSIFTRS